VYPVRDKWNVDLSRSLLLGGSDIGQELAIYCEVGFFCVEAGRLV